MTVAELVNAESTGVTGRGPRCRTGGRGGCGCAGGEYYAVEQKRVLGRGWFHFQCALFVLYKNNSAINSKAY